MSRFILGATFGALASLALLSLPVAVADDGPPTVTCKVWADVAGEKPRAEWFAEQLTAGRTHFATSGRYTCTW